MTSVRTRAHLKSPSDGSRRSRLAAALLACALASACTSETPGHEQRLLLYASGEAPADVDSVPTNLASVELLVCPPSLVARLLGPLRDVWLPRAHAHSLSSPTRIGSPLVLDMAGAMEGGLDLGTFLPPYGRYCELRLDFEPADPDAPGAQDAGTVGSTMEVRWRGSDVATWRTHERQIAIVPLVPALDLTGPAVQQELKLVLDQRRWWDEAPDSGRTALGALTRALRLKHTAP